MRSLLLTLALALALVAPAHAGESEKKVDTSDLNPVELYLFQLAMKAAPPATAWRPPGGPHADETPHQRTLRYKSIATDIYQVVFAERTKTIAGMSRIATAGFLVGMAVGESSLAPDADLGPCYRGTKALRHRCDGGLAVGILQVQMGKRYQKPFWDNRRKLIGRALRGLRGSFYVCRKNPLPERLAAYGAGSCESEKGKAASRKRWKLIQRVRAAVLPPKDTKRYVIAEPKEGGAGKKKVAKRDE